MAKHRPFFAKAGARVFALDEIAEADFSGIEELRATVTLKSGTVVQAEGIEALELAMQVKPSVVEGRRMAYARRAWWVHNMLGHPLMQLLAAFGAYRLAFRVHDGTVPQAKGRRRSRSPL